MEKIRLETQEPEPVDEATKDALEIGLAQLGREEGLPLEQVRINIEKRYQARRISQQEVLTQ